MSDALEMRALSGPFGIPEAAVMAVAAGTDLLCLGRDQDRLTYLAVRDALLSAVAEGRLAGSRLEEAASRVAELRAWLAARRATTVPQADSPSVGSHPADPSHGWADGVDIGLTAARRAIRAERTPFSDLGEPLVIELVPPSNIAVGSVPWGLGSWVPADSVVRLSTGTPEAGLARTAGAALARAAGRFLIIVVRDAHRYQAAREIVSRLVAARPDAVVVEMGLPIWRPPTGGYVATYGAARTSSLAAAEILGLASA